MGDTAQTQLIAWAPQKGPQTALITCPVFEAFFGGARGGGKTDGMLGEWAIHADRYGSDAIGGVVNFITRQKAVGDPFRKCFA